MKKGLSSNQIESRKNELYEKYYGDECRVPSNLKQPITKEDQIEFDELDFRGWVNSCLIYSACCKLTEEELTSYRCANGDTILQLYNVSLSKALEIIEEQKECFKDASVTVGVYTDCEGVTYNSCEWKD